MKIFISGASGLVGGQCLNVLKEKGHIVVGSHLSFPTPDTVYYNTLEPQHPDNFNVIEFAPEIIIHCGALTHVDYCETHPEESYEKTVLSTINLLNIAEQTQAQLILLSTDYVFDGTNGPYIETDNPHPVNVYGQHKLEAEKHVLDHATQHLILRITNVYGPEIRHKNFISRIIQQCVHREKLILNLPLDQYATPTNAMDIARTIHELITHKKSGIYHISGTDYMNRVELALNVLKHFPETEYELTPLFTSELQQTAKRPLMGGLISQKFKEEFPLFLFSTVEEYVSQQAKNQ